MTHDEDVRWGSIAQRSPREIKRSMLDLWLYKQPESVALIARQPFEDGLDSRPALEVAEIVAAV